MIGAFVAVAAVAKLALKVVLLPLKLLFFPIAAVIAIVKFGLLFALGTALVAVAIAVIVPLLVLAALVAIPIAVFAAIS